LGPALKVGGDKLKYQNNMPKNRKTSSKAAKAASSVLRDKRTSKNSKRAAGSALSQRAPKRK
jgi:hypothetical protein